MGTSALITGIVIAVILLIAGISIARLQVIDPGHVGVSVQRCGNSGGTGVRPTPIPAGYYWRDLFCETVIEYPTSLQTIILTKSANERSVHDDSITVQSSEGMPINRDTSLSL